MTWYQKKQLFFSGTVNVIKLFFPQLSFTRRKWHIVDSYQSSSSFIEKSLKNYHISLISNLKNVSKTPVRTGKIDMRWYHYFQELTGNILSISAKETFLSWIPASPGFAELPGRVIEEPGESVWDRLHGISWWYSRHRESRTDPQVLVSWEIRRKDRGDSFGTALTKMRRQKNPPPEEQKTRLREK